MKMFAGLQISFLAQVQKACWHILLQHIAYWDTTRDEKEIVLKIISNHFLCPSRAAKYSTCGKEEQTSSSPKSAIEMAFWAQGFHTTEK